MTDKPENPLAYQVRYRLGDTNADMTLRDYFAGQALIAYAALEPKRTGLNASMAYCQADEMLKARRNAY